jgi:hypothetical protein
MSPHNHFISLFLLILHTIAVGLPETRRDPNWADNTVYLSKKEALPDTTINKHCNCHKPASNYN